MNISNTLPHFGFLRTLVAALLLALVPATLRADVQQRDTLSRSAIPHYLPTPAVDMPNLRHRMMTSPAPVEIHQQGRHLCITSRYAQLLPVYNASGTLYSSFRLAKGTNWLSGLPRGSYFINNRKFTIN
jgi:hypothetical protein